MKIPKPSNDAQYIARAALAYISIVAIFVLSIEYFPNETINVIKVAAATLVVGLLGVLAYLAFWPTENN